MTCKICKSPVKPLFEKRVLNKYDVTYFQCAKCDFIQTSEPVWLEEAYKSAITALDIGLIQRNIHLYPIVGSIIHNWFDRKAKFLDYGGGYGLLVRLMRDQGYDFYRQDIFCENLFAKHFDVSDLPENSKFELVCAFELFEHLNNPIEEIKKMLSYGGSILFSTELQPATAEIANWEYLSLETGQHIALYSVKTLQEIASQFNLHLNTNGHSLHLLSPKKIDNKLFRLAAKRKAAVVYNYTFNKKESLLMKDYAMIKNKLNSPS
jgi:2-polyprenyl-3-methyl-5-hydroxy-6-metoxy-1,4-benzoquinol methylase